MDICNILHSHKHISNIEKHQKAPEDKFRLTFKRAYEYQYDVVGNWIEMKVFDSQGKEMLKVVRAYE